MAELPYRPEHVADAIADTEELTNEELGAFVRLQRALWRAGGYLPDDPKRLARFTRAGSRWGKIAPAIMSKLTVLGGKVSDPALLMILDLTRQRRRKAAEAAAVRWAVENGRAEGARNSKADVPLNSSNPLKSFNRPDAIASSEHVLAACNHNQNHLAANAALSAEAKKGSFEVAREQHFATALSDTLYGAGVDLLLSRVDLGPRDARGNAKKQITRWLSALDNDAETLAGMLAHADQREITGAAFINLVDSAVKRLADERSKGFSLPFPMMAATGG